jgi:hypothetical protein
MTKTQLKEDIWYTVINGDGYAVANASTMKEAMFYMDLGYDVIEFNPKETVAQLRQVV